MKTTKLFQIFLFLIFLSTFSVNAQSTKKDFIYINGTKFTYPLLEKWITEYKKVYPDARIKLLSKPNDSVNLKIVAHTLNKDELGQNETYIHISRYAILPIANERNVALKKEFKKGISQEELKKVFFQNANSILEDDNNKNAGYTIYTRANQACATIAFANHFGLRPGDLKGKKISGDDQYLTLAVQKDTTGITYNNLGYIFDIRNRTIVKGIKILPIDINENGKIDREEQVFDNLDQLTEFIEKNPGNKAIPIDYVSFIVNKNNINENLKNFINWLSTEGQNFNNALGFLRIDEPENLSGNLTSLITKK